MVELVGSSMGITELIDLIDLQKIESFIWTSFQLCSSFQETFVKTFLTLEPEISGRS